MATADNITGPPDSWNTVMEKGWTPAPARMLEAVATRYDAAKANRRVGLFRFILIGSAIITLLRG
jgi:hypothetical protein